jgi:IS5 family transposase
LKISQKRAIEIARKPCKITINLANFDMKPKKSQNKNKQGDLFRVELENIVDTQHSLVKLSKVVNWERFEEVFGTTFCSDNGRPAISTRLMVSLHYLKFSFNLSDDEVLRRWVENPYYQYFSGMKWFEHKMPINPSSMTRWRKRIGEAGAEELLRETIEAGLALKAVKPSQLARINVDTTVMEKNIRFPTDGRLYDRAREKLVNAAEENGIKLRQNYNRKSRQVLLQQSRYSHAKQMKRAAKCTRTLKTYLGRVARDVQRNCPKPDPELKDLLATAQRLLIQQKTDKKKIYSIHEPHVDCISKGKAHKRYEFGCKVSIAATSRGGWIVGSKAINGNPYDGHTLTEALEQVSRLTTSPSHVFVDMGYKGHGYQGDETIHVDRRRRGNIPKSLWKWMKRRAAIEPGIGHLKNEHRMDRNGLKGIVGDKVNAVLSAAGMNFWKLLRWLQAILRIIYEWIVSIHLYRISFTGFVMTES